MKIFHKYLFFEIFNKILNDAFTSIINNNLFLFLMISIYIYIKYSQRHNIFDQKKFTNQTSDNIDR
jgi:hypothetical protein